MTTLWSCNDPSVRESDKSENDLAALVSDARTPRLRQVFDGHHEPNPLTP